MSSNISSDSSSRKKARIQSATLQTEDNEHGSDIDMPTGGHETKEIIADSKGGTATMTSIDSSAAWNKFLEETNLDTSFVDALEKSVASKQFSGYRSDVTTGAGFLAGLLYGQFPTLTEELAKKALEIWRSGSAETTLHSTHRGLHITDGLDTELVHSFDLDAFTERIDELFNWHEDSNSRHQFLAPYMALIQSSGMGKTKLFTEFRKKYNGKAKDQQQQQQQQACKTILCVDAKLSTENQEKYFDYHLLVKDWNQQQIVESVWTELDKIARESNVVENGKLVLLFDEAQGLMHGVDAYNKPSYVFRAIRWWLRAEREVQVVAVFAGTTAKLSNFYLPDPPELGTSRSVTKNYKNFQNGDTDIKKLYLPFFKLHTISCFLQRTHDLHTKCNETQASNETDAADAAPSEFSEAAVYGRPLFAFYNLHGQLDGAKLTTIAHRLVLSVEKYQDNLTSCYSVLGSRVQMGIVNSFYTASELVSSGYACLVDFQQQKAKKSNPIARVTFMPDPVCATLAMRFMDNDDDNRELESLKGQSRKFWTEKAKQAFATQLCLPDKGDAGEIFAALYMLFCGDILRKEKDTTLSTFSVSLDKWYGLLQSGGKAIETEQRELSNTLEKSSDQMLTSLGVTTQSRSTLTGQGQNIPASECTVSFVQVCRNHFRANSFCQENSLKFMYCSGLGSYTYQNCKAFDIVSSIKVVQSGNTRYHPLLVSVKNWMEVSNANVVGWLATMKEFLGKIREDQGPSVVCLIILLGCSKPPYVTEDELSSPSLFPFPASDVFRLVSIPGDDEFGISNAIQNLRSSSEQTEIYSSHAFMVSEKSSENLLRSNSSTKEAFGSLFKALKLSKVASAEDPESATKTDE